MVIDEATRNLCHGQRLPAVTIGAQLRELEARCPRAMTRHDRRELAALRELLTLKQKEN